MRRPLRRSDLAITAALSAATLGWLVASSRAVGYTRDEGFYLVAARAYGAWLRALVADPARAVSREVVDLHWAVNHEHPPLLKTLFALSHEAFGGWLVPEGTSYRLPAMVLAAGLVGLVHVWGTQVAGRLAGVVAAASLIALPRVFFHAHLACFDVPVTALFTATAYAFWRAVEARGATWVVITALLFGATLAAKHNAWFLPFLFVGHAAALGIGAAITRAPAWPAARRPLAVLGLALVVGPLVAWATWPWVWRDTAARVADYVAFHLHHEHYDMELLGASHWRPPFPRSYAPIMSVATIPATTLLLAAWGLAARTASGVRGLRARDPAAVAAEAAPILWLGAILVSYGPWISTSTPIFGGTKHWMTAYPFLALFAGIGAVTARDRAIRAWPALGSAIRSGGPAAGARRWALSAGLAACAITPGLLITARSHPWGLTAYTPLVGGAPGAATLGLNRTFWGYTTASAGPWLADEAPREARVYAHDTLGASWDQMIRDGTLRADLRRTRSVADADVALQHHEMHMQGQEYQAWIALGTTRPALVLGPDGVPVLLVYRRAGRARVHPGDDDDP